MSKKTNTFLFILGGTVFNIIITAVALVLLLVLYSILVSNGFPADSADWALPVIFILSLVASFFAYRVVLKIIMKKVDMDKYFDPLFGPRKPRAK